MAEQSPEMKWKEYSKELQKLQTELCHLREWVKKEGLRVIIVFEGRDAARQGWNHKGDHGTCEPARLQQTESRSSTFFAIVGVSRNTILPHPI